jgi:hypothetical protein
VSSPADDPFAPPKVDLTAAPADAALADYERIRRAHLNHEASIRSVGALYVIGAVVVALGSMSFLVSLDNKSIPMATGFLGLASTFGFLGVMVRRLDRRARIPVVILASIGLLGFPFGTLISAYILYLFLSAKGSMVFSPEYKRIRERTPHIVYRTPRAVLGLAFLLLLLLLFGLLGPVLMRSFSP